MASSNHPPTNPADDSANTPNSGSGNKRKEHIVEGDENQGKKKQRSKVWDHFTRLKDNYNKATCNYCSKELVCPTSSGTSNMKKHPNSCKQYNVWLTKQNQMVFSDNAVLQLGKLSDKEVREATNELLVTAQLPLAFIESQSWKTFCNRLRLPRPHSRRTATRDIYELHAQKKAEIRKLLGDNKQRLSLTTDIWVAPCTRISYMVITAHYVDINWKLQKLIIGFKTVPDHRGVTICNCLMDCLAEWGIKRLFSITMDNATANTNAIAKFKDQFCRVGNDALVLDGDYMHIRCATHILNLIVKEGLSEIDDSVCGIRNAIQYVRSSGNRQKSFELRVATGKMHRGSLPLDVGTRWNSTYLMLNQALKFRLAFDKMEEEDVPYRTYFLETIDGKKRVGPLVSADWEAADVLMKILVLFYNSTMVLSASTTAVSYKCYNKIVTIITNLKFCSRSVNASLKSKAIAMIEKLDKYWSPSEINKMIIVASVFDPSKKMKFAQLCFETLYGKDSREVAQLNSVVMDILERLFNEYNIRHTENVALSNVILSQHSNSNSAYSQEQYSSEIMEPIQVENDYGYQRMDSLYKELVTEIGLQDNSTELEIYLKENVENPNLMAGAHYDILSWWKRNCLKFPVLSEIAKDVLAMQISSVASESAFSTSGRVIEPSRSCLTPYSLEILMCVEQWLKSTTHISDKGIITIQDMLSDVELQDELMREFEDFGEVDRE